jgi:chromatin remodeling complex protein RSC6
MAKIKPKTKTPATAKAKTTKTIKAKPAKTTSARKPNAAFMKEKKISDELSAIVGKGPMARTEITKKLWVYIKKHKLQDPKSPRNIVPDEKLAAVIGKKTIDMFKMTAAVSKHIRD